MISVNASLLSTSNPSCSFMARNQYLTSWHTRLDRGTLLMVMMVVR